MSRISTLNEPERIAENASQKPPPCMSGHRVSVPGIGVPASARGRDVVEILHRRDAEQRVAAPADGREVDVFLAPHHALGHAGRAAGPEAVPVVG